jgi:hypothetical protein
MHFILIPIQLILLLFLVFAFSRVYLRFREGALHLGTFVFWSVIWLLAIVGVLFPEFTTYLANKVGIGRGADAVIYISLALLFYLVYRTNVHLENIRQNITDLVKKLALESEEEKSKKTPKSTNKAH